jgi:hypothetical protein
LIVTKNTKYSLRAANGQPLAGLSTRRAYRYDPIAVPQITIHLASPDHGIYLDEHHVTEVLDVEDDGVFDAGAVHVEVLKKKHTKNRWHLQMK